MENYNPLNVLLILPLIFLVLTVVMPKAVMRIFTIFGSVSILAITIYQCLPVLAHSAVIDERLSWVPELGLNLSLKLDSTSVWFVVLTALTSVIAFSLKGTWYRKQPKIFSAFGFFLIFALNAAFLSTDLVVFYLAYEAVFIPMIFMVGIWGENQKATSVFRFFLMSFVGSILMLVSIFSLMALYHADTATWTSSLSELMKISREKHDLFYPFLGFFLAFAIKVPLVPFHGWLKEVYVNAPMPSTIWMSGILSKLGVFGFLRFVLALFPEQCEAYQGWLMTIAAISIVYPAFLAIKTNKPKALLAYSSISHLGFVMLGVFTLKASGVSSAILLSVGHTIISSLLFFMLEQIESRREDLMLNESHGLARAFPVLFVALFVGVLGSVSLPGTINFSGEFLVLLSSYPVSALCTILSCLGVILGAVYMLKFYQQLGLSKKIELNATITSPLTKDLGGFDLLLVLVLIALVIYGGFQPGFILKG